MFHNNQHPKQYLSPEQIEIRIWGFVVIVVMIVFAGITASMLYSVIFVTQPIKSMAPIDQAFTKMLNDIVLLIVGGIGGIMTKGLATEARAMMDAAKSNKDAYVAPPPPPVVMMSAPPSGWSAPPPPQTPPTLESDEERARHAEARALHA